MLMWFLAFGTKQFSNYYSASGLVLSLQFFSLASLNLPQMDPDHLTEIIFSGKEFSDPAHLNLLYEAFQRNQRADEEFFQEDPIKLQLLEAENLKEKVGEKSEELEQLKRIKEIMRHFKWIPVPKKVHQRFQKSAEISTRLRDHASNLLYSDSHLDNVLHCLNVSIAFAPPNSPEIALALEKRANVLLQLKEAQLAQLDIKEVASNQSYPLKSGQKLIDLQNKCARDILKLQQKDKIRNTKTEKFVRNDLYQIKHQNERVDNLSDFCEIDFDPRCGRRIIVTKDVMPGEVIMVDEPYEIILEKCLAWEFKHCWNCSIPVKSGIPCDCCTFAWYCSNSCKFASSRGPHKYEKYLSYLKSNKIMSLRAMLAARLLFKVGPDQLYKIFESKNKLYFGDQNCKQGFSSEERYNGKSYLPIFHLISHPDVCPLKAKSNVFKALILTNLIEETSDFFLKYRYYDCYNEFKDFISSLILRHMDSIEYNAITLSCLVTSDKSKSTLRYGAAIYPTLCLINHDCDPNCVPVRSVKLLKTSVIALKCLKAGDEVTFSYSPHFSSAEYNDRQQFLFDKYNFKCSCEACLSYWGIKSVTSYIPEMQCNACGRYLLTGQCPRCQQQDEFVKTEVQKLKGTVDAVNKLKCDDNLVGALQILKSCLKFCYSNLPHNSSICLQVSSLFKEVIVEMVNN